ncbi:hypothetical protein cyc_05651 [Cyclospora cayetanensis]|uniref:Uncharacterized protein n=1 Tax=Cyclospora cayetanensis TaxID=88456 RepID=A0A1D3D4W7_9EIME|nr:hypothetical protein cyc_05651 [Cyclospora cayetanensis]
MGGTDKTAGSQATTACKNSVKLHEYVFAETQLPTHGAFRVMVEAGREGGEAKIAKASWSLPGILAPVSCKLSESGSSTFLGVRRILRATFCFMANT